MRAHRMKLEEHIPREGGKLAHFHMRLLGLRRDPVCKPHGKSQVQQNPLSKRQFLPIDWNRGLICLLPYAWIVYRLPTRQRPNKPKGYQRLSSLSKDCSIVEAFPASMLFQRRSNWLQCTWRTHQPGIRRSILAADGLLLRQRYGWMIGDVWLASILWPKFN